MSGKQAKRARRSLTSSRASGADLSATIDRAMLRDDISWLTSTGMSVQGTQWEGFAGLTLKPHIARVTHESFALLAARDPAAARAIDRKFGGEIATARHSLKLVDDTQKNWDGVVEDFARIELEESEQPFTQRRPAQAVFVGDRLVSSSRLYAFQSRSLPNVTNAELQAQANAFANDAGQTMVSVAARLGAANLDLHRLNVPNGVGISKVPDLRGYSTRANRLKGVPAEVLDLLSAVECLVNGARLLFDLAEAEYAWPVLRARIVVLNHARSTLAEFVQRYAPAAPTGLSSLLVRRGLTWVTEQRRLRNRAMHYGVPASLDALNLTATDYGIVAATTGVDLDEVRLIVTEELDAVSDALRDLRLARG